MIAAVVRKELKFGRKSFLIWGGTILILVVFTLAMFPSFSAAGLNLADYISMFPEGMIKAFGMDPVSFTNILGFYTVYNIFYTLLLGGMYAMMLGSSILLKEQNQGSAEFLLTKPYTRVQIAASKIITVILSVILLNIIVAAGSLLTLEAFKADTTYKLGEFMILCLYSTLFTLFFGMLGVFVSVIPKKAKSMNGICVGIMLGTYMIDALSKGFEKYRKIGIISPFRWINYEISNPDFGLDFWRVALLLGGGTVFALGTLLIYRRKDIYLY